MQLELNLNVPYSAKRPSAIIMEQRQTIREQAHMIDVLKGALAAHGINMDGPAILGWNTGLTPQEAALVGALYTAYPRVMRMEALIEVLPGNDHVIDRQLKLVAVKVCHVRKKLGKDAIQNIHSQGYRLGSALYERMRREREEAAEKYDLAA